MRVAKGAKKVAVGIAGGRQLVIAGRANRGLGQAPRHMRRPGMVETQASTMGDKTKCSRNNRS